MAVAKDVVDALAMWIASFDKQALAETKRLVDVAGLPSDADIRPEWVAFLAAVASRRSDPRLLDHGQLFVAMGVLHQWMLSKGQEWDWLSDPLWRVQTLAIFFAVGLIALIFWELRHPSPVVNFRPLGERNFAACCLIIFCAFAVLYAASTSLPALESVIAKQGLEHCCWL